MADTFDAITANYGPRQVAFNKAIEYRKQTNFDSPLSAHDSKDAAPSPLGSFSAGRAEYKSFLPRPEEVDQFDASVQDRHAQDEARMKQLRFQGR